jgi:uncharacterized membrane protein
MNRRDAAFDAFKATGVIVAGIVVALVIAGALVGTGWGLFLLLGEVVAVTYGVLVFFAGVWFFIYSLNRADM